MKRLLIYVALGGIAAAGCGNDIYSYPAAKHVYVSDGDGTMDYVIRKEPTATAGTYTLRINMTITDGINDDDCFHASIFAGPHTLPVSNKACADGSSSSKTITTEWSADYDKNYWPLSIGVDLCREKDWFAADNCVSAAWYLH
ncbi:MAG: hypothetical protein WBD02_03230 [Acidimicrobiia bacterium]